MKCLVAGLLLSIASLATAAETNQWAVAIDRPGLPNFHKVSDALYRGAQPTEEGFRQLEKMGIKTIVCLRSFHTDSGKFDGKKLGYEHLWIKTWHPEDEEVVRFLKIVADPKRGPVFVHCQHGADRTGTMCAIYRVAVQGWTKDQALAEMTRGDFGYHTMWKNLIKYIRELDLPGIKTKAGLSAPATGAR